MFCIAFGQKSQAIFAVKLVCKAQRGSAVRLYPDANLNKIVIAGRAAVPAPGFSYRQKISLSLDIRIAHSEKADIRIATSLEDMQILGMINITHRIGLAVRDAVFHPNIRLREGITVHRNYPVCKLWILFAVCVAMLSGCAARGTSPTGFEPEQQETARNLVHSVSIRNQGFSSWTELARPLDASLAYIAAKNPEDIALTQSDLSITWGEFADTLTHLRSLLPRLDADPELLSREFVFLRLEEGARFSGYYGAEVLASRQRTEEFRHPIYKRPPDLHSVLLGQFSPELVGLRLVYRIDGKGEIHPYHTRAAIERGILGGQELVWLNNPIDVYFLQIQGSGRIRFEDGSTINVLYDGDNGRPYRSLGRDMIDLGFIAPEDISMQSIRAWLAAHPERRDALLQANERFVFFKLEHTDIVGAMSSPLTPYVSLAVDRRVFPLGVPLFFRVQLPGTDPSGSRRLPDTPLVGLGFAQDTGGAIKKNRIDLFCGFGERASFEAGHLNTKGDVWLLLRKGSSVE